MSDKTTAPRFSISPKGIASFSYALAPRPHIVLVHQAANGTTHSIYIEPSEFDKYEETWAQARANLKTAVEALRMGASS